MVIKNKTKIVVVFAILIFACNSQDATTKGDNISAERNKEQGDLVARGEYLVTIGGCHDCHSPKIFNQHGFTFDSSKLLSGHPAGSQLPPVDLKATTPGYWYLMGPDLTAFVGPWGISYSANLTSDSATGLGGLSEELFVRAIRTGKHFGQPNGRPILPPMPWELLSKMTDEDFSAVYAYLRSIPPVSNRVPGPVPPNEVK